MSRGLKLSKQISPVQQVNRNKTTPESKLWFLAAPLLSPCVPSHVQVAGVALLLHIFLECVQAQEKAVFAILMLYYSLKHSLSAKEEVREARHARMGESGRFYANIINIYDISEIANV